MSACEKCWVDARRMGIMYTDLRDTRDESGEICTPEEQAGPDAKQCPVCKRMTLHQYTDEPMCGCPMTPTTVNGGTVK